MGLKNKGIRKSEFVKTLLKLNKKLYQFPFLEEVTSPCLYFIEHKSKRKQPQVEEIERARLQSQIEQREERSKQHNINKNIIKSV